MTLIVTFAGKTPLPSRDAGPWYEVWSYTVRPGRPADLHPGQRIALAIPADVDVRDPALFPGVPALADTFVESDSGVTRRYVGRTVADAAAGGTDGPEPDDASGTDAAPGTQTISFVAPPSQEDRELFLVTRALGAQAWSVTPFAKTGGGPAAHFQTLPAPGRRADGSRGHRASALAGALPRGGEVFRAYHPLSGRLDRTASRLGPARVNGISLDQLTGSAAHLPDTGLPDTTLPAASHGRR